MDNATRLHYLEAMGITIWVPRQRPIASEAEAMQSEALQNPVSQDVDYLQSVDQLAIQAEHIDLVGNHFNARSVPHDTLSFNNDWQTLQQQVAACQQCSLCETRTQTVFGVGNRHADWMLIGEAPGQNEDLQGEPFVGKAGQLLTEMLRAIGLRREEVYIANMLKCRPPNNRDPLPTEVQACHAFLQQQIILLQPKLILAVGRIAAQNLLNSKQTLSSLRGIRHQLHNIPLIVIPHPAYLLRSLLEKAKAWEDLQFALSVYKELEK
ncbi:uracil-DNA glycosylase [Methylomonas sp. AM2-LC]|uniref:uracil-DNA glycosylase n=1 Tax=Methylomonas sp. AM2-LC TaxID=3153301 RepID=UPI0032651668